MTKLFIGWLSYLFPAFFTKKAYQVLTNPQIKKLREHEIQVLKMAEYSKFEFQNFDIQTYHWKGGGKTMLLIHGWEGQAGNFSEIVQALLEKGCNVFAFDGPSHGYSSKGETSLFEFSNLVAHMIRKVDARILISHSFGSVATTFSLFNNPDIHIDKYVLMTTPDRFSDRIKDVSKNIGVSRKVTERLVQKLEEENDITVDEFNVSDFVKTVNVGEALVVHDKNDRVIPIEQAERVVMNWPVASLEVVEGTGHFRILRTEKVVDKVVDFLI